VQRGRFDWGGNLAAFAFMVLLNVLSNALPINGQSMPEISANYPSLFTPAGFTFSIWGVIYLSLLVFVIFQALPAQRSSSRIVAISLYFKVNCVANALWIVAWHYDLLAISLLLMFVILATLFLIYRSLLRQIDSSTRLQHVALHLPFSLYTGWITVASIANVSVLQTHYKWDAAGLTVLQWTYVKLAIAGAIGAFAVLRLRDPVFVLVIAWAAYGISVMQSATPEISGAAMTLSLLALILAANEAVARLRRS